MKRRVAQYFFRATRGLPAACFHVLAAEYRQGTPASGFLFAPKSSSISEQELTVFIGASAPWVARHIAAPRRFCSCCPLNRSGDQYAARRGLDCGWEATSIFSVPVRLSTGCVMGMRHGEGALLIGLLLSNAVLAGEPAQELAGEPAQEVDSYELLVHSESYAQLFRRAMLPGPGGALVATETELPLHQYVSLSGYGFDTFLGQDSAALEVSAWGSLQAANSSYLGHYDGDLQTASVLLRAPGSHPGAGLRLGRQQVAGGAARFARFDGAHLRVPLAMGMAVGAYAGWVVLPRWDRAPAYYHLGAASDSALRDPEALETPSRAGAWLAGGRVSYDHELLHGSLSVHEQRQFNEVSRRNLGLDLVSDVSEDVGVGSSLLMELDSADIAALRLWGDIGLSSTLDLNAEYFRADPALLLSRQAVLSVFSAAGYDETGGRLGFAVDENVTLTSAGYVQFYADSGLGARLDGGARVATRHFHRTVAALNYLRVITPDNGYHSVRSSLSRQLLAPLHGTLQFYAYFYDEPIRGYRSSSVYATTLEYDVVDELSLMWAGSLAHSPYASLDATTLLRLTFHYEAMSRRAEW
jgi:hypothetical protein